MTDVGVLAGRRVRLRLPVVADAEALLAGVTSDPEATRYLSWTPHPDVAETRRVITDFFNVGDEATWLMDLARYAVFPNLGPEPQDCLQFAKGVR